MMRKSYLLLLYGGLEGSKVSRKYFVGVSNWRALCVAVLKRNGNNGVIMEYRAKCPYGLAFCDSIRFLKSLEDCGLLTDKNVWGTYNG